MPAPAIASGHFYHFAILMDSIRGAPSPANQGTPWPSSLDSGFLDKIISHGGDVGGVVLDDGIVVVVLVVVEVSFAAFS